MNKKFYLFLSLSFVLLLVLSACSGDKTKDEGAAKDGKPFEGEELTVLYMSGVYADAAELMKDEFEEETGAKVTVVDAPFLQLFEKEFSSLISDAGDYDVMSIALQWDGQFYNYLEPLPEDAGIDFDKFIPAIADETGIYDGVRFGVPMAADAFGMYYRADLFEEKNIEADASWTWDEYKEIANALTDDDVYGAAISGQVDQLNGYVLPIYWANGGALFTKDWQPITDRDLLIEAVDYVMDLKETAMPEGMMSYDSQTQLNAFVEGEFATGILWPSFARDSITDESSSVSEVWDLLPMPDGGNSPMSSWDLAIPKSSENKELALEWIKMYTSEEKQRLFLEEIGIGPTISSLYTEEDIVEKHPEFLNHLKSLEGAQPPLRFAGSQEYMDYLNEQISAALTGSVSSEKAVDNVIEKWTKIMEENGEPTEEFTGK